MLEETYGHINCALCDGMCNRVGNANRLRAWVLRFLKCSWSPAAGFFKPGGLQRLAHQARRFCRCRLRKTSHIPAASLAPLPPETRARAEGGQTKERTSAPLFICKRDYLTKSRLSFVGLRCSFRHPDACDRMATTVTAAHHFIWRHLYASMQAAQTPAS